MNKIKEYRFCDLYEMSSGISTKPEQAGHGSPFVSFSTAFNNFFLPKNVTDLMNTSKREQEIYSLRAGDILLTRTSETINELGMSCVVLDDFPNGTYSGFLKRLRPTQVDVTYPKFMGFYLRSKLFRKTMTNNAVLTLRASLNEEIFSYLKLYLPDFDTQKRIGDFLYALSAKIELNNRINAELEAMAKLIYDYWFVQFDFPISKEQAKAMGNPKFEGKPYKASGGKMVWSEELKREVPEGWGCFKLNEFIKIKNGFAFESIDYSNEGIPVIRTKDFNNKSIHISDSVYLPVKKAKAFNAYNLNRFDLLVVMVGASVGNWARVPSYILPALQNQNMWNFQPKYNAHKFYCNLLVPEIVSTQLQTTNGSARKFFTKDVFYSINVPVPSRHLIEQFNNLVRPIYEKIDIGLLDNNTLSNLRDWLLPMLMNGQVKIKDVKEKLAVAAEQQIMYE